MGERKNVKIKLCKQEGKIASSRREEDFVFIFLRQALAIAVWTGLETHDPPCLGLLSSGISDKHDNAHFLFFFFAVPGLELRSYTLSHSTSRFCVRYF
jgi:hypothetical protein